MRHKKKRGDFTLNRRMISSSLTVLLKPNVLATALLERDHEDLRNLLTDRNQFDAPLCEALHLLCDKRDISWEIVVFCLSLSDFHLENSLFQKVIRIVLIGEENRSDFTFTDAAEKAMFLLAKHPDPIQCVACTLVCCCPFLKKYFEIANVAALLSFPFPNIQNSKPLQKSDDAESRERKPQRLSFFKCLEKNVISNGRTLLSAILHQVILLRCDKTLCFLLYHTDIFFPLNEEMYCVLPLELAFTVKSPMCILLLVSRGATIRETFFRNFYPKNSLLISVFHSSYQCRGEILLGYMHRNWHEKAAMKILEMYDSFSHCDFWISTLKHVAENVTLLEHLIYVYKMFGFSFLQSKEESEKKIWQKHVSLVLLNPDYDWDTKSLYDRGGWSILHWAAFFGDTETLNLLIHEKNFDIFETTRDEEVTIAHIAASHSHVEVISFLQRYV